MRNTALGFAVAAALLFTPCASFAQTPAPEADSHFRHGVELYKESDYSAALIEFRRAYELDPKFQVLYNIAEAYYQIPDYANALKTFEKYLAEGGSRISPERRIEVAREIDKLKGRVAKVELTVNQADVEIAVDDVPIGKAPFAEPVMVSAGRRKISATRPGKAPVVQIVEVAGGDLKKIAFNIPDDAPAVEERRPFPWVSWTITGALAVGWGATGAAALAASSDLKNQLAARPGNQNAINSAQSKAVTLAGVSDGLMAATLVMGGVSVYLTVRKPGAPKLDQAAPPAARIRTVWLGNAASAAQAGELRVLAGPTGGVLSATF